MKAIKYVLAGALVLSTALPVKAQDVKAPIDAITKVVIDAKGDVKATKDAVKEFTKTFKKNPQTWLSRLTRMHPTVICSRVTWLP